MKRLAFVLLLSLAACATDSAEIAKQCPQIGIDVQNPVFFQKQNPKKVGEFYSCMMRHTPDNPAINPLTLSNSPILRSMATSNTVSKDSLTYQAILWLQVFKKQKTPEAAQEAWLKWQQQNHVISASDDAAAASRHAATAANNAAFESNMNAMRQRQYNQQQQFNQNYNTMQRSMGCC